MESGRRTKASINAELEQLEAQLKILIQRESDFQQIIDHAQGLKDDVSRQRAVAERTRMDLEGQKEPINWLPTEMLIQIFSALTDQVDYKTDNYCPSVVVSHVCTKWRVIALSTPQLWRRISTQGFGSRSYVQTCLKRSALAPLELDLTSLPSDARRTATECYQMAKIMQLFSPHFSRVDSLSIQCSTALPFVYILPSIKDHRDELPRLNQLVLTITTPSPSFLEAPSILNVDRQFIEDPDSPRTSVTSTSRLFRLKLEEIPLFNVLPTLIANLRSLELVYSPRRIHSRDQYYYLKMSSLCRFLALTPYLEELVLINTVPYFDVRLPSEATVNDTAQNLIEMEPIILQHLKTLDWTFPYSGDIPRFLSMVHAPNLEKLDLWVEDFPKRGADTVIMRGYTHTSSPSSYIRETINYPVLRDLSLQCAGEDTTAIALRRFSFPALEKLAFTNVDTAARRSGDDLPSLPIFPRLESIFRDPRLPNLTHLTLSHFSISLEQGRVEAMLGYMPMLTSLSLDSCPGAYKLMEGLQGRFVGINKFPLGGGGGMARTRRGVKVCPRLEALSFWGCQDVNFETLLAVVESRNRNINGFSETLPKVEDAPNGATPPVTGGMREENEDGGRASNRTDVPHMGRKIKPLRKLRRDPSEVLGLSSHVQGVAPNSSTSCVSTIPAMQESFRPAHIIYLRVMNCRLIDEKEALRFKGLGVVDVIWAGLN